MPVYADCPVCGQEMVDGECPHCGWSDEEEE